MLFISLIVNKNLPEVCVIPPLHLCLSFIILKVMYKTFILSLLDFSSFFIFYFINIIFFMLQYCIGFAIYQYESTMGVHVFRILNPSFHLPPCTIPLGHPSAPTPSILYPASNLDWRFVLICCFSFLAFLIFFQS